LLEAAVSLSLSLSSLSLSLPKCLGEKTGTVEPQTQLDTAREQAQRRPDMKRESLAEAADRLREEAQIEAARDRRADTSRPQKAAPPGR
jgi:hypothetical protein